MNIMKLVSGLFPSNDGLHCSKSDSGPFANAVRLVGGSGLSKDGKIIHQMSGKLSPVSYLVFQGKHYQIEL